MQNRRLRACGKYFPFHRSRKACQIQAHLSRLHVLSLNLSSRGTLLIAHYTKGLKQVNVARVAAYTREVSRAVRSNELRKAGVASRDHSTKSSMQIKYGWYTSSCIRMNERVSLRHSCNTGMNVSSAFMRHKNESVPPHPSF